jgi:Zn-dependent oligopeptidase
MAYHNNQMGLNRRAALLSLLLPPLAAAVQEQEDQRHLPIPEDPKGDHDQKLPNGKSRNDAIAKKQHEDAMRDVDDLVSAVQELKQELEHAGNYVVPVSSVRKTEEIEKLARRIRGRLKN